MYRRLAASHLYLGICVMDGSKNTFGAKSRFAQMSKPRKAGVVGVVLLIGFAVADPNFLANDPDQSSLVVKSGEDIESLFGESSDASFVTETNAEETAPVIAQSDYDNPPATLTIPSTTARTNSLTVQSVSYPDNSVSSDDGFPSIPADDADSFPFAGGTTGERLASAMNKIQHTQRTPPAVQEPQPSIRFMGMIYPVQ